MHENNKSIILAGGNGFLGRALSQYFTRRGHSVFILTRSPQRLDDGSRQVAWDGRTLDTWSECLEGALAVVNLAGRTVNCRYTDQNRRLIMNSRVESTRVLGEAIGRCRVPPRVWINTSTATIYKHTFGPAWDETGEIGAHPDAKDDFSVQVAVAWENEVLRAETSSTRKALLRLAMVLGPGANSVFPVLHRLARFGLGGRMGTGRQYVSWIHESDFCRAIDWIIAKNDFAGIVNVAAPNPLPNTEMMRILRNVSGVPFGLPASKWMLELGAFFLRTETELIIKSRRVAPDRLLRNGFQFRFAEIHDAFNDLIHCS